MENHDFDHDDLVLAMGTAMRSVSIRLIACVGLSEAMSALFAEAISCAQADMTPDQIAVLLRGLAEKIEAGYLSPTEQ
jgi:hypothetical protein